MPSPLSQGATASGSSSSSNSSTYGGSCGTCVPLVLLSTQSTAAAVYTEFQLVYIGLPVAWLLVTCDLGRQQKLRKGNSMMRPHHMLCAAHSLSSWSGVGPRGRLAVPSTSSMRPRHTPMLGPPCTQLAAASHIIPSVLFGQCGCLCM
jgi:hypothetical protein